MSEKFKLKKKVPSAPDDKPKKEKLNSDSDESQDTKEIHPSLSVGYIKDEKTGKWKVVNPAGSIVYNYLYRDEFPDE